MAAGERRTRKGRRDGESRTRKGRRDDKKTTLLITDPSDVSNAFYLSKSVTILVISSCSREMPNIASRQI